MFSFSPLVMASFFKILRLLASPPQSLASLLSRRRYVEDRDTRKPKAISDISDYWVENLNILPYMPTDNVGAAEARM